MSSSSPKRKQRSESGGSASGSPAAAKRARTAEREPVATPHPANPDIPGDYPRPKLAHELKEGQPGTLTGRPVRLYADGIFDMFHFGHAKALQQVKEAYPNVEMIAGCCNDEMTHRLKGRTVMVDTERYESLRHCKWVDEVLTDAPWVITDDFLEQNRIDFVCHDALPYADTSGEAGDGDVYTQLKKRGMFYETQRTDGISTSDLIVRIISEYDTFIRRNLQRGYSAEEMNVPWTKEKQVQIDMAMNEARTALTGSVAKAKAKVSEVKDKMAGAARQTKEEVESVFRDWGAKVDALQKGFLDVFDRESPLRCQLRQKRGELLRAASNKLKSPRDLLLQGGDDDGEDGGGGGGGGSSGGGGGSSS